MHDSGARSLARRRRSCRGKGQRELRPRRQPAVESWWGRSDPPPPFGAPDLGRKKKREREKEQVKERKIESGKSEQGKERKQKKEKRKEKESDSG